MSNTEYQVTGMSCGHCEISIRKEVGLIPGVEGIEVSAATGRLVVSTGSGAPADDDAVITAVGEAGYSAARV